MSGNRQRQGWAFIGLPLSQLDPPLPLAPGRSGPSQPVLYSSKKPQFPLATGVLYLRPKPHSVCQNLDQPGTSPHPHLPTVILCWTLSDDGPQTLGLSPTPGGPVLSYGAAGELLFSISEIGKGKTGTSSRVLALLSSVCEFHVWSQQPATQTVKCTEDLETPRRNRT